MTLDLGIVSTMAFEGRLLLALDVKWMKLNNDKPLEFEAKIEDGKLVLVGPKLIESTRTGDTNEKG